MNKFKVGELVKTVYTYGSCIEGEPQVIIEHTEHKDRTIKYKLFALCSQEYHDYMLSELRYYEENE